MANPEHVAILEQGVEEWNRWRIEYPAVGPDLQGAHLREAAVQSFYDLLTE